MLATDVRSINCPTVEFSESSKGAVAVTCTVSVTAPTSSRIARLRTLPVSMVIPPLTNLLKPSFSQTIS